MQKRMMSMFVVQFFALVSFARDMLRTLLHYINVAAVVFSPFESFIIINNEKVEGTVLFNINLKVGNLFLN